MRSLCLIFLAVVFLAGAGMSNCAAAEPDDSVPDPLSEFLHAHRLPLVEARTITDADGERSLLLYGYVATDLGKRDAEDQARDFMDDPDIKITNRIVVRPELLTLGTPANSTPSADGTAPAADDDAVDGQAQAAANYASFPDQIGNTEDYTNQERNDQFMLGNGATFGGVPLILAILGSGAIVPPISPPVAFGPTFYPRFSPSVNPAYNPPIGFPAPPTIIVNRAYNPPFGAPVGFPRTFGPSYFPPPFPAGPAPMFPATGGMPFPSAVGPGFGGFAGHSFPSGFSGGFHGGFGGGHR
ncbi:MAG: hypothetical protein ACLQU2_32575 [Candidatus Binataceae bacterium]